MLCQCAMGKMLIIKQVIIIIKGKVMMSDRKFEAQDNKKLVGLSSYGVWDKLCHMIDENYDMEHLWNNGGKAWN